MKEVAIWFVVIAAILGCTYWAVSKSCAAKWEGTFNSDFALFSGCRIEVQPGRWIPEERYREIEE